MGTFELRDGEVLVGVLRENGGDFPWIHCSFEPTAAFDEFRPLFERLLVSVESEEFGVADEIFGVIQDRLQLVDLDDPERIGKFLLHVERDTAWFRFLTKEQSKDWDDSL
jgi:hypothetical protein